MKSPPEQSDKGAGCARCSGEMIEGFPTVVLVKNSSVFVGELV